MTSPEPPIERYLWAADAAAAQIPAGELVQGRYQVVDSQIWRDTQPEQSPHIPQELPEEILPYLRLYPHRLHVPEAYGFCPLGEEPETESVLLLENAPLDEKGNLYPAIVEVWQRSSPVRQVYWLWQMLQLWQPLSELGVASSLLIPENIRVQGWRVWLLELVESVEPGATLQELGACWRRWATAAGEPVAERLQDICRQMVSSDANVEAIAVQLNQLLLEQTVRMDARIQVGGATDKGSQRADNEDTCYPKGLDLADSADRANDRMIPHLSLVCDGIGGHEGGEVASELALRNLKLLVRSLLVEIGEQTELVAPEVRTKQLEEIVRVVNNLIADRNDSEGRSSRQRMGTTLVMALQLPQQFKTPDGSEANTRELYLVHVGDSRAYWITPDYCQQLTIDDDVVTREVRLGRSLYREALKRPDAQALTQALGTRDAQLLRPTITRFIVEEDGLLLLCSDGLSDNNLVEQSWPKYAKPVLKDKISVEAAVRSWIELANEKNGHDNISVVLASYRFSPEPPALFEPKRVESEPEITTTPVESEMTDASKALLYDESNPKQRQTVTVGTRQSQGWQNVLGALVLLLVIGIAGYAGWRIFNPQVPPPQQDRPQSSSKRS